MSKWIKEDLDRRFNYHPPKPDQVEKYTAIRASVKEVAELINSACPESRERSLSITKLEEAIFWANASIARNE